MRSTVPSLVESLTWPSMTEQQLLSTDTGTALHCITLHDINIITIILWSINYIINSNFALPGRYSL